MPDHSLPPESEPVRRLVEIMRILRAPGGCPWDREQTVETLKPYLVEEVYEVLDAIDSGDRAHLAEELGDLLLQIVFQSQICGEDGQFTFDDVARCIGDKLIRRHPHVFGAVQVADSREVIRNWENIKKDEKGNAPRSVVAGIPRHLPALQKAHQVQKKVARVGFDWDSVEGVLDKIDEELREVRAAIRAGRAEQIKAELGDLLFSVVNLGRFLGHDAEDALNATVKKFVRRFQDLECRLHAQGRKVNDCKLDELDRIWNEIKQAEQAAES